MKRCVSKFQPCVSHYDPYETTVPTLEEYEAQQNNTNGNSGKWTDDNTNTLLNNIGNVFASWLKPADEKTFVIGGGNNNQKDNTMLYVGIGGAVLVVLLILIVAIKK